MRRALLALALVAIAAGTGAEPGDHIVVTYKPATSFVVTFNGEEIPESPILSSAEGGILAFVTGPAPGVICFGPVLEGPAAFCSEIER